MRDIGEHRPQDPRYRERVRDEFSRQKAMAYIGASLAIVEPGFVEIHLPYRDDLTQQHEVVHGGVVSMIVDSACGFAALSLFPADASVLTTEYKINLLAPARAGKAISRAWVVKSGRTLTICSGQAYVASGAGEQLIAVALETVIQLQGRPDPPQQPVA